jgi:thiamine-phosphate pyrophosphorylase
VSAIPAPLLVVTDRHQARAPLLETVAAICAAGGRWIWFRDRDLDPGERRRLAENLSGIVRSSGAFLTVGGDVELAAYVAAEGVHLPSGAPVSAARRLLGARALIGVSAHGLDDVRRAAEAGADYVTLSPIFPSSSKPGYGPALGVSAIGLVARCGVPVFALGGITPSRAVECRLMGATGVAVMGDLMRADDPARLVADYQQAFAESERRSSLSAC